MFDVRPVDNFGQLDWERIENVGARKTRDIQDVKMISRTADCQIIILGKLFQSDRLPFSYEIPESILEQVEAWKIEKFIKRNEDFRRKPRNEEPEAMRVKASESQSKIISEGCSRKETCERKFSIPILSRRKNFFYFTNAAIGVFLIFGILSYAGKGIGVKNNATEAGDQAYQDFNSAIQGMKAMDFEKSSVSFKSAFENFSRASDEISSLGDFAVDVSRFVPIASKVSSGKSLAEAGKNLAEAGNSLNIVAKELIMFKDTKFSNEKKTFLEILSNTERELKNINSYLLSTREHLDKINVDDLPEDKKLKFVSLKSKLPEISTIVSSFINNSQIFIDLLGGNGPRKYLFLFQNNQEIRATGGFIGSYGLLDISRGRIRNFFIDGIFNPDGQLVEKVVPPLPIQKISAAWSLHDSNWFPDFPKSARKAIVFYEKTGGPTADGVITFTPEVMRKLLEITGPIEMPEYEVTLDANNFIEKTQMEVEVEYDKEENNPKKILADLATVIMDRLFSSLDAATIARTMDAFMSGLEQKHILIYSSNPDLEKIISERGWSGEIINTPKDYLSVVNTNINGFKTDGVIDEKIQHTAEIQADGSIIDTVEITRHHNGGNTQYQWWNGVNANYLRVYVPQGSELLAVEGQTREFVTSPLDYDALRFRRDPDVEAEEKNGKLDDYTGVRTYEDSGKTVFANWTYVSPQETIVIKYRYLLPFRLNINSSSRPADSYSLLAQKQSGSIGSQFKEKITFPQKYSIIWKYPDLVIDNGAVNLETDLKTDKFIGLTFSEKND